MIDLKGHLLHNGTAAVPFCSSFKMTNYLPIRPNKLGANISILEGHGVCGGVYSIAAVLTEQQIDI